MTRDKIHPGYNQKQKEDAAGESTRDKSVTWIQSPPTKQEHPQHSSGKVQVPRPRLKWSSQPRVRGCGWPGESRGAIKVY